MTEEAPGSLAQALAPGRCRPFALADAMILVAASALSLAMVRILLPGQAGPLKDVTLAQLAGKAPWRSPFSKHDVAATLLVMLLTLLAAFVYCWTPAYLVVRLRRDASSLHRRLLQPGVTAWGTQLAAFGLVASRGALPPPLRLPAELLADAAIPIVWGLLAVTGRWRPEPGWIEWLGRLVGVGWFVLNSAGTTLALGLT